MKTLQALLLTAIAVALVGCVENPRNNSFLEQGTSEPIPLSGIIQGANQPVVFQAYNFNTNQWDDIGTAQSGTSAVTKDGWHHFSAPSVVLPHNTYWEAVNQAPTYHRRARVRASFPGNGGTSLTTYYTEGPTIDQCIMNNYNNGGTLAAVQNCQAGGGWANIKSCKFPPCTPW